MRRHVARYCLIVAGLISCLGGCASNSRWIAWKTDMVDTVKAFSGTGEYLGASTQSREIERSLSQHRQ